MGTMQWNALGLAAIVACALPASAQRNIELIPFAGAFVPTLSFGDASRSNNFGTSESTFWQTQGVSVGARLRVEMTSQVGFEFGGRYVASGWREDYEVTSGPGIDIGYSLPGSLLVADARATYRPRRSNLYGLLGAGFMSRSGRAWDEQLPNVTYKKSNPTAVAGLGLRASGSSRLQIDATAELLLYSVDKVTSAQLVNGPFQSNGMQSDLLITIGLPIRLAGR